jgi:hypothetical protein
MDVPEMFFIVEPQRLVQLDLSQAIREICPHADIAAAKSLRDAEPLLGDVERLTGAIIGIGVQELKDSGMGRRIEALGAWIICLNGRQTDAIVAQRWHPLTRPFTSDAAQDLVRSLLEASCRASAAG